MFYNKTLSPTISNTNTYLFEFECLHGALIGRAERSEANECVGVWMLEEGVLHLLVDRNQDFLVAPVVFLFVVATVGGNKDNAFLKKI